MGNPNRRTEKVLARQIEVLRAELHEKELEYDLLDWHHEVSRRFNGSVSLPDSLPVRPVVS